MIKNSDMPAPDAVIEYSDGMVGAAMFHYAGEDDDLENIARNHGFEVKFLRLDDDPAAGDLVTAYENDASDICERWHPQVPDGWQLGAKNDTEDGPYACFIRRAG